MVGAGSKRKKSPRYVADFVTALSPDACRERLLRADGTSVSSSTRLTPVRQRVHVERDGSFVVERVFAGALRPICFHGCLDAHDSGGTWVHGAITDDATNQVLIEGLIVFLGVFLITAALFLRLGGRAFAVTLPLLLIALSVGSLRWRTLQRVTEDVPRWLRQRLYLTVEQVRRRGTP
ncbi:MAG: hypothetical protein KatS3mg051_1606 [Anaerolineae bacterium]|nr:MAG: hypothetical protein KatS3mg051_1606 [Anaerolineae bacterium]